MTILQTARLVLRPLALSDAAALLPIFADAETMQYWSRGPILTLDEMREHIQVNISGGPKPHGFAVCQTHTGPAQGWTVVYGVQNRMAGAGYILAKQMRGKGYAEEALRAFLDYAFDTLDLHRIHLDIDPENSASIRLAQRIGFRWEGLFRENFHRDGEFLDSIYYAMLAREWRALRG